MSRIEQNPQHSESELSEQQSSVTPRALLRVSQLIDDGELADAKGELIKLGYSAESVSKLSAGDLERFVTAEYANRQQLAAAPVDFTNEAIAGPVGFREIARGRSVTPYRHEMLSESFGDVLRQEYPRLASELLEKIAKGQVENPGQYPVDAVYFPFLTASYTYEVPRMLSGATAISIFHHNEKHLALQLDVYKKDRSSKARSGISYHRENAGKVITIYDVGTGETIGEFGTFLRYFPDRPEAGRTDRREIPGSESRYAFEDSAFSERYRQALRTLELEGLFEETVMRDAEKYRDIDSTVSAGGIPFSRLPGGPVAKLVFSNLPVLEDVKTLLVAGDVDIFLSAAERRYRVGDFSCTATGTVNTTAGGLRGRGR